MAESAAVLAPEKVVLLPEKDAGCPLADMVTPEGLRLYKEKYPDAAVVTYINSSAAVKAESDICVTSANAALVVDSLEAERIIFVPDCNLAHFVSRQTKKRSSPGRVIVSPITAYLRMMLTGPAGLTLMHR